MRTALIADEVFERHVTPAAHPEQPQRTAVLRRLLGHGELGSRLQSLTLVEPTSDLIALVHSPEYIDRVEAVCAGGGGLLDAGDTWLSDESCRAARCAVGAVLRAVDAVTAGAADGVFCAVRPPGHHALRDRAMGFCVFNNVAVGASYAIDSRHLDRVFIMDWDVHHGNGTQAVFYRDPRVFYCSMHRWPYYPGTGSRDELGEAEGSGYTLNVPLPPGSAETAYRAAVEGEVIPALERFKPQLLMISSGFDAHRLDPLGGMALESTSFGILTRTLLDAAGVPVVSVLEGGYHLEALAQSVTAHIRALLTWEG